MYVTGGYLAACLLKTRCWFRVYGNNSHFVNIILNVSASEIMAKLVSLNLPRYAHSSQKMFWNILLICTTLTMLQIAGFLATECFQPTRLYRYIVFSWYMHPLKHALINILPLIIVGNSHINATEYDFGVFFGTCLALIIKNEFAVSFVHRLYV